jgi:hypothetical protein
MYGGVLLNLLQFHWNSSPHIGIAQLAACLLPRDAIVKPCSHCRTMVWYPSVEDEHSCEMMLRDHV